jgi:transglutaminase-like putative cysteine protease
LARRGILAAAAAVVIAAGWLGLERGEATFTLLVWAIGLAVLPAVLPTRRLRLAAVAVAVPVAIWRALGLSLLEARPFSGHDFFGPAWERFTNGFLNFYDIALPFTAEANTRMHAVVLVAMFGFSLATGLALGERRPLLAAGLVVVGAGWPSTLYNGWSDLGRGALILVVALAILAALAEAGAPARLRQAGLAGAVVVAGALAVGSVPAVAQSAFLSWETWDPYNRPEEPVSVRFVWDSDYGAIEFPKKKTVVFTVGTAVARPLYWRATSLDEFHDDAWLERPLRLEEGPFSDPLVPEEVRGNPNLISTEVTIRGLDDDHLIGASVPLYFEVGDQNDLLLFEGGTALVRDRLERGQYYTVLSYAAQPTPQQLAAAQPSYPEATMRYLVPESRRNAPPLPPIGTPGRVRRMATIIAQNPALKPFRPLYRIAREVAGDTRSPYAAAVALEDWFRRTGGFTYDEAPPQTPGVPTLVGFVSQTRRGYCQHYAGAMALMLRYLGVPARVAAGFTSGRYDPEEQAWTVTDREAHTWVEAWFPRFGWLPFDPTPGRGNLSGPYTVASLDFSPGAVIAALGPDLTAAELKLRGDFGREPVAVSRPDGADIPGDVAADAEPADGNGGSLLRLLALVAAGAAAGIALFKLARRRARYLTRDPRRLAGAYRRELAEFLTDQRLDVPSSATLAELGALLRSELGVDAAQFVSAASAARYGPERQASEAARRARRELRRLERVIRQRLPRTARARGLVSLRSLGLTGA